MQTPSNRAPECDLAVLGAGPAGLCLAREAARRGLRVAVIAPGPRERWPRNYGCFEHELEGIEALGKLEAPDAIERRFDEPLVWLGDGDPLALPHAYVKLDGTKLQRGLLDACDGAGVAFHDRRAASVEHDPHGSAVAFDDGSQVRARVVVDASGFESRFTARNGNHAPGFQAAYGELLEVEGHPFEDGQMALMDFRQPDGSGGLSETFAYTMPVSATRIFVEETSLVARPAMDYGRLRSRFGLRLERLGLRVGETLDRELCLIPMGMPMPLRRQRTIAFGAAASLVHPATGYQIARALRLAAPVSEALAAHLDQGPVRASQAAYAALWSDADLSAWELYRFGMEFLVGQPPARVGDFLNAFFRLPAPTWLGYMTGRLAPGEICSAMLGVFRHASLPLKTQLIRAGAGPRGKALLRAALPDNPL